MLPLYEIRLEFVTQPIGYFSADSQGKLLKILENTYLATKLRSYYSAFWSCVWVDKFLVQGVWSWPLPPLLKRTFIVVCRFQSRAQCIVSQYGNYSVQGPKGDIPVDGVFTQVTQSSQAYLNMTQSSKAYLYMFQSSKAYLVMSSPTKPTFTCPSPARPTWSCLSPSRLTWTCPSPAGPTWPCPSLSRLTLTCPSPSRHIWTYPSPARPGWTILMQPTSFPRKKI